MAAVFDNKHLKLSGKKDDAEGNGIMILDLLSQSVFLVGQEFHFHG